MKKKSETSSEASFLKSQQIATKLPLGKIILRSMLSIGAGLVLGLLVDELFQLIFHGSQEGMFQLILQFALNVAVVVALRVLGPRLGFDLVDNVFFISIFIGVQQSLFWKINQIDLLPKPNFIIHSPSAIQRHQPFPQ